MLIIRAAASESMMKYANLEMGVLWDLECSLDKADC